MIGVSESSFLREFLPAEARRHSAEVIALGIVSDHLHLLLRLPLAFDVPALVKSLKGVSARLANKDEQISRSGLRWAKGYVVRSVSPRNLRPAVRYVLGQRSHHPDHAIPVR